MILTEGAILQLPIGELSPVVVAASGAGDGGLPTNGTHSTLEELERQYIIQVLRQVGGVISGSGGAAAMLGMKRTTLQSKIQRLGISREEFGCRLSAKPLCADVSAQIDEPSALTFPQKLYPFGLPSLVLLYLLVHIGFGNVVAQLLGSTESNFCRGWSQWGHWGLFRVAEFPAVRVRREFSRMKSCTIRDTAPTSHICLVF